MKINPRKAAALLSQATEPAPVAYLPPSAPKPVTRQPPAKQSPSRPATPPPADTVAGLSRDAIAQNVEAAKLAEVLLTLALDLCKESSLDAGGKRRFFEVVHRRTAEMIGQPDATAAQQTANAAPIVRYAHRPMTDREFAAFANRRMDFGKHSGQRVRDVPVGYLVWLLDQDDFKEELRRYEATGGLEREQEYDRDYSPPITNGEIGRSWQDGEDD